MKISTTIFLLMLNFFILAIYFSLLKKNKRPKAACFFKVFGVKSYTKQFEVIEEQVRPPYYLFPAMKASMSSTVLRMLEERSIGFSSVMTMSFSMRMPMPSSSM